MDRTTATTTLLDNSEELAALLPGGWVTAAGDRAASAAVGLWTQLACRAVRVGGAGALADDIARGDLRFPRAVLALAEAAEGGLPPPDASAFVAEDGEAVLRWTGTWTAGRWAEVGLRLAEDGEVQVRLAWASGTGRPSRFLAVQALLAQMGEDAIRDWGN